MDFDLLSSELLRSLRGKRSQNAFARRLRYRSNIVYSWETGRAFPTAGKLLFAAERVGVNLEQALTGFLRQPPDWLEAALGDHRELSVKLLNELKGRRPIVALAASTGLSRFAIARWLKGVSEPRVPDFLRLVEACSFRTLDFISQFIDPVTVPSIARQWAELEAARKATYESPWTQAVLRCLELIQYQQLEVHQPGWIAECLGISRALEEEALELLIRSGQIVREHGRYAPIAEVRTIDTRHNPESARQLRAFWSELALTRLRAGSEGLFAHNVFNVSATDYQRLRDLQKEYFREVRSIVAESQPEERVVLLNLQLLALDERTQRSQCD